MFGDALRNLFAGRKRLEPVEDWRSNGIAIAASIVPDVAVPLAKRILTDQARAASAFNETLAKRVQLLSDLRTKPQGNISKQEFRILRTELFYPTKNIAADLVASFRQMADDAGSEGGRNV